LDKKRKLNDPKKAKEEREGLWEALYLSNIYAPVKYQRGELNGYI